MKNIDFKRDILPHLIAIAAFLLIVIFYFSPVFFEKKTLDQHDILQWKGGSEEIIQHRAQYHEEPLWTERMFSGMPTAIVSTEHYGDIYLYVHKILTLGLPHPVSLVFIGLLSFYLLMLAFDVKPILSAIGAIGFAFASFTLISLAAGHNAKVVAMAYTPLALAAAVWTYRKNALFGGSLFGLALAMQIRSAHLQVTYYLGLVLVLLAISEIVYAFKSKTIPSFIKSSAFLFLFGLIGVLCNAGQLYTNYEYSKASIRGKYLLKPINKEDAREEGLDKKYAFDYSYLPSETFTFLIPNYSGGGSGMALDNKSETYKALSSHPEAEQLANQILSNPPIYFGGLSATAGPIYAGAIICFLFVLGMFIVDSRWKWWLFAATILSFMLSWGSYFEEFNYFMFDHFPMYNKFRAVTMATIIAQLTMPILAVLALDKALKMDWEEFQKPFKFTSIIVGGFLVLVYLTVDMWSLEAKIDPQLVQATGGQTWLLDAIKEDRASFVRQDTRRTFIFIALAAGVIFLAVRKKVKYDIAIGIIAFLTLVDLWSVDKRYLNKNNFAKQVYENFFTPTESEQEILQDKSYYRVLNMNNPFNDARTSYFFNSIGGYCAAKMRRYQDLIERNITPEMEAMIEASQKPGFSPEYLKNLKVLNMLNTKYIKYGDNKGQVIVNPYALGNAWFVSELKSVNGPDAEIEALKSFNPRSEAIVDVSKNTISPSKYDTSGTSIKLIDTKANYQKYQTVNKNTGFAVFSEVFYREGWKAYVDGKELTPIRVNYILRGLNLPAGNHIVEFKYHPESYYVGNNISLYSSIGLLLIVAGVFAFQLKKKEN